MLSQIRQISDGNYNTVFVKNKEQKFNLDKEIHDLECWKQSRNHVYRKEERELLGHLDKLRQQQEYLHHLDEERSGHVRGSQTSSQRRHSVPGSVPLTQNASILSPQGRESIQEMDPRSTPELQYQSRTSVHTPNATLPPVTSGTDKRALHRAEAHTNICLICQLPRWSHGHPPGEAVCCCDEQEGTKLPARRFTTAGREQHNFGHIAPPIQVGQRRHSLMMARLDDSQHEHKPHPPERGHTGKSQQHDHVNAQQDHVHIHHHLHMHHDHGHHLHHHGNLHHGDHVNNHVRNTHGAHDSHAIHGPHDPHHSHYSSNHGSAHLNRHVHNGAHAHHGGHAHHSEHVHNGGHAHDGHVHHGRHARDHTNSGRKGSGDQHRHHQNGYHDQETHTPSNSPRRYSRQSFSHYDPHISHHEPIYPHPTGHQYHMRRHSTTGSVGTNAQESDTRTRDHELHWDRHQVCKLKGMITDPHYKEQLEVENGRTYPWSGLYPPNNVRVDDIEELKKCRYLRFSKLNLMSMKENPEEEVEVFEKEPPPP